MLSWQGVNTSNSGRVFGRVSVRDMTGWAVCCEIVMREAVCCGLRCKGAVCCGLVGKAVCCRNLMAVCCDMK